MSDLAARLLHLHDQVVRSHRSYLGAPAKTARARNAYFNWRDAERKFAAAIAALREPEAVPGGQ